MEYVIVALIEVAVVIVGLIPPVVACKLFCSFSGIAAPSTKKTLLIVISGLVISTFIEMIIRRFIDLPGATSIVIFCTLLLIVFMLLWQACHKMTPREAALLASVIMIVILIYTVTVPPQFNAYALLRAGMWWVVNNF